MTQLLLWLAKSSPSTATKPSATTTAAAPTTTSHQQCGCITKFVRKLKRRSKMLCAKRRNCRYRYDPLSYALNFDTSGTAALGDDGDYYRFYAFASRFAANPTRRTVAAN